jgi:predicted lipid-binding transport protein (Tim44 family)
MTDNLINPTPQFSTAEYAATSGSDRCKSCNQTLGSQYYRVNGATACSYCAEQLKLRMPQDSHQTFVRGLVFGIGGAILGLVLYSAFGMITGLMVGYVSLAVGYIVGKAMMQGSKGIGGRRYQIAAVALTYAAVSIAAVPMAISQYIKQEKEKKQHLVQHAINPSVTTKPSAPITPATDAAASKDSSAPDATPEPSTPVITETDADSPSSPPSAKPKMGFGVALGMLALVGLASPFLELADPIHGIIGLIILLVGIRIAWRITAGVTIDILGPFKTSSQSANAGATS